MNRDSRPQGDDSRPEQQNQVSHMLESRRSFGHIVVVASLRY